MRNQPLKTPENQTNDALRIAIIYLVVSILWVVLSDLVSSALPVDLIYKRRIEVGKGMFFVIMSSFILYTLVNRSINKINNLNTDLFNSQQEHERVLNYFGSYDIVTGLPNRLFFEEMYEDLLKEGRYEKFAFLFIDIDSFSHINDLLGRAKGDILLMDIGMRLRTSINREDIVSRINGDEFGLILSNINSEFDVDKVVSVIQDELNKPIELDGERFILSSTIGIALSPRDGMDFETLLKKADIAMQYGKIYSKTSHSYYNKIMDKIIVGNAAILSDIRKGLINKEFKLHYQLIKDIKEDKVFAVESLIRWFHPKKGYIPPLNYIPIAEKTDLIFVLREFILDEAFSQMKAWKDKGVDIPIIGINISLKSFCSDTLVEDIERKMKEYGLGRGEVALELTESGYIEDIDSLISNIDRLRALGIIIALDDFGIGYSSLIRLKMLPLDYLKIDKSFIDNVHNNYDDEVMVKSFIDVANSLKLRIIAEGIEYKEQIDKLLEINCTLGQGYYIAKPMAAEKLEELIKVYETSLFCKHNDKSKDFVGAMK
ncbi:EAL domain-containing protein [Tissierella creatinini]|nr:EAL domain-containing protein [Tissierella creatinini]TJX63560.1 EAL domain-containing protein [Soehngenia saccharolytica]